MDSPSVLKPQTIKQAKAAFKARGGSVVSEREQKQIDRQVQLDQRAWRLREQERKRIEASKKRQEAGRQEKEERDRALLATQVRRDKFGYKSSQMHLGAFFQKGMCEKQSTVAAVMGSDDDFGDSDVDDETLLHALESPINGVLLAKPTNQVEAQEKSIALQQSITEPSRHDVEQLDSIWDDLDSSTQIARDLANDESQNEVHDVNEPAASFSFCSGDFDLSAEELDELIVHQQSLKISQPNARQMMPPPPRPANQTNIGSESPAVNNRADSIAVTPANPSDTRLPFNLEYSMSQLESFVDDDLQLTQMAPD